MSRRSKSSRSQKLLTNETSNSQTFSQSAVDEETTEPENLDILVNNVVRYVILKASDCVTFKKAEIQKHCMPGLGRQFDSVMKQATKVLQKIYGYQFVIDSHPSQPAYIICNTLPNKILQLIEEADFSEEANNVLLLLILTHIFMSNVPPNEESLYGFLKGFGIKLDEHDEIFGNVKEYINTILPKKKYLLIITQNQAADKTFHWGLRADNEISKLEILKFVCMMFQNGTPEQWDEQYKKINL